MRSNQSFAGVARLVGCLALIGVGEAAAGSLGGPLALQDEGSFFINGRSVTIPSPYYGTTGLSGPGQVTVGQMYVHFRVPANAAMSGGHAAAREPAFWRTRLVRL